MKRLLWGMALAAVLSAQPRLVNGKLETRASNGLERDVRSSAPAQVWLAYTVPMVAGHNDSCGQPVTLEEGTRIASQSYGAALDGGRTLVVFMRAAGGRVDRVRPVSGGCEVNAGGRTVVFLTGVQAAQSVEFLAALASGPDRGLMNAAILTISLHAGTAADDAMIALARGGRSSELRSQVLFWLAQRASSKAVGAITDALRDDPDTEVKKRAVFALSQLPKDEGIPHLIEVARTNRNLDVRKQAFFWLGQSRDSRAIAFFEQVLAGR